MKTNTFIESPSAMENEAHNAKEPLAIDGLLNKAPRAPYSNARPGLGDYELTTKSTVMTGPFSSSTVLEAAGLLVGSLDRETTVLTLRIPEALTQQRIRTLSDFLESALQKILQGDPDQSS